MINIIIISFYISNVKSSPDPISNIHTFSSATPACILVLAASDNEKESFSGELQFICNCTSHTLYKPFHALQVVLGSGETCSCHI